MKHQRSPLTAPSPLSVDPSKHLHLHAPCLAKNPSEQRFVETMVKAQTAQRSAMRSSKQSSLLERWRGSTLIGRV
jgi:hypothetical protein